MVPIGPLIQQDLTTRHLLPDVHLLDGGYVNAEPHCSDQ